MHGATDSASPTARILAVFIAALLGTILLLTSTLHLSEEIWPYDVKRLLQLLVLVIILSTALLHRELRQAFCAQVGAVPVWIRGCLGVIFSLGVLSALVNAKSALHLMNSLSEVALMFLLVAAVLVIAALRRLAGELLEQVSLGLLALTAMAVGLQEVMGVFAAKLAGLPFRFEVALLHYSFPRFYNQVQSWIIPAMAALPLLFVSHRLARALAWVALSLSWFVVFLTAARGTTVGLLGAFTLGLCFLPAIRKRLLITQGSCLLAGLGLYLLLFFSPIAGSVGESSSIDGAGDIGTVYQQKLGRPVNTSSGRLEWLWPNALEDIKAHPLIGKGPMNYACTEFRGFGHPHNFLLQVAAEWGLPVVLLVCAVVAGLITRAFAQCRGRKDGVAAFLLLGVVAASIHALFSGVMTMPASQVAGLLVGGLLIGRLSEPENSVERRLPLVVLFAAAELALAVLLLGLFEVRTMTVRSEQLSPGESLHPRMWQDSRVCSLYVPDQAVRH